MKRGINLAQFDVEYMGFEHCLGSENGTQSLRAGDFVLAGSSRGGGIRCAKRFW